MYLFLPSTLNKLLLLLLLLDYTKFCVCVCVYIYSGVGRACGRSAGRWLSGPTFSFSTHRIWSRCQFSLKTEHFLILVGWGMGVVAPRVGGCRDIHFRICRTEFSLG